MARPGSVNNILVINRRFQEAPNRVSDAVWDFLDSVTEANHRVMVQKLNQFLKTQQTEYPSLRLIVSIAEGKVAYDSGKKDANTWKQFIANLIGDNNNTRISVLYALKKGRGVESHFDTDISDNINMMSFRQGFSSQSAQGVVTYSVKQTPTP